jgi:hypothetical protein
MAHTDKDMPFKLRVEKPRKRHARLMRSKQNFKIVCCFFCDRGVIGKHQDASRSREKRVWKKEVFISLS